MVSIRGKQSKSLQTGQTAYRQQVVAAECKSGQGSDRE